MQDAAVAEDSVRERIVGLIAQRPGITKSDMVRQLGIAWGTAGHHLAKLRRAGLVVGLNHGRSLHLATSSFVRTCPDPLFIVPLMRDLLSELETGPRGPAALSRVVGLPPSVVQGHLATLAGAGLVASDGEYHPRYTATRPHQAAPTPAWRGAVPRAIQPARAVGQHLGAGFQRFAAT